MDEETTVQTDVEEASETSSAFDEGWDETDDVFAVSDGSRDYDVDSEDSDTAEESEEAEADADQQEADDDEGGESDGEPEGEAKGDKAEPDQGEFVLKHLGEEKSVGRDEVVALAQKGLDYDRIREKWDGVKDDIQKLRMYESFLQELAESRDGDIESLIDETRTRTLIARAEARGEELAPAAAAAMAVKMRTDFVPGTNGNSEEARQEKSQREVSRFLHAYPDVKAEDIPKEVWDDMNENDGDLLGSYQRYENRKLKEELKALKKDLEDTKQQKKNKARSTGSTKSVGSAATIDPFDAGWDDAL